MLHNNIAEVPLLTPELICGCPDTHQTSRELLHLIHTKIQLHYFTFLHLFQLHYYYDV